MPVMKLTKNNVDKIPFTDKGQVLYHDQALKGFMLRVGQTAKTYCVYSMVNRKSRQISIGRHGVLTTEQARDIAKEKLFLMSQDIDPVARDQKEQASKLTLRLLIDEFLNVRTQLKERTRTEYRYYISKYLSAWMDTPILSINDRMVLDRYLEIGKENGKATANNVRRYLSSLINYAVAVYDGIENNPVEVIAKTRSTFPDKRRKNVIAPSQLKAWWQAVDDLSNPDWSDYLKLILLTGLRRQEASTLKWEHIDFDANTLFVPDTKNGEALTLPLGSYLRELLLKRRANRINQYVFYGVGKSGHLSEPRKAVERVRRASGIYFTVHDLRRTYMTIAASLDISAYALKRLVNHKISHDVTGGYVILNAEQLRKPVQKIEDYILGQANGR